MVARRGEAKASLNVNKTRKGYYLLLFHTVCCLNWFPFSEMPHSLTDVIAGLDRFAIYKCKLLGSIPSMLHEMSCK